MYILVLKLVILLVVVHKSECVSPERAIFYVKPNTSATCPHYYQSCLTLDQYASQQSEFFTTDSIFLFLDGNHSFNSSIHLTDVSNILLQRISNNSDVVAIILLCTTEVIYCNNVSNLTIQGLTFEFASNGTSALKMYNSEAVLLFGLKFQTTSETILARAISANYSNIKIYNCSFLRNTGRYGGALFVSAGSNITISESNFIGNKAQHIGGAIFANGSKLCIERANFTGNSAMRAGGLYCETSYSSLVSTMFVNNTAELGGGVALNQASLSSYNITVTGNSKTAIFIYRSNASFCGNTTMKRNVGYQSGGAVTAEAASLSFTGFTWFEENYAPIEGGAIALIIRVNITFSGFTCFINNSATTEGGGAIVATVETNIFVSGSIIFKENSCTTCYGGAVSLTLESHIIFNGSARFESNFAEMGGAIYLRSATLTLKQHSSIVTLNNMAKFYGGGIFNMDYIDYYQCCFVMREPEGICNRCLFLPSCFLKLENYRFNKMLAAPYSIKSYNDSAGLDGHFLYGGLIDRCKIINTHEDSIEMYLLYEVVMDNQIVYIESYTNTTNAISSEGYALCFCESNQDYDCYGSKALSVIRGSKFTVSVLALSQGNTITAQLLLAEVSKTARLKLNQNSQNIFASCTSLSYNMYSTEEQEILTLYPNKTCRDQGLAAAYVNLTFEPCPPAFELSGDHCICEKRLQKYNAECNVYDEENYITKKGNSSSFWMGADYSGYGYEGLILYQSCPIDYCKTSEINISMDNLDVQCNFNRRGLLCGTCAENYSLILGSSKCQKCSDITLVSLAGFVAAGIMLVVFLTVLRVTVANGMINSIILYANIIEANRNVFFDSATVNVLTVFIAWMNLDFGFQTCFYHGMDAYVHTWLQFVFPIYVWVLVTLIILTSRYSTVITKLIGSNPIAVLATLLLMSYAKLLKTIIQIFSSVQLEYPHGKILRVWLKDATVPYLESRHLILAVVGSIIVGTFFIPYTFFLLFGYKIYPYSRKKYLHWFMIRTKPLLDSYYAPYMKHTRYWTGLLLLVRSALYIIFSFDSISRTGNSLFAITLTFTGLLVLAWLSKKLYKSFIVNVLEGVVYLNLIVLAAALANEVNSTKLVFSLVGMIFAIMIVIILYHFHVLYVAKSKAWQKLVQIWASFLAVMRIGKATEMERAPLVAANAKDVRIVTNSVINLRESLLEEQN